MRYSTLVAALLAATLMPATFAHANPYGDDLAKCLVKSTTPSDKVSLMVWVFAAMSAHPAVKTYANVSQEQRDLLAKQTARLFERLLTVDCRAEAVAALKFEGSSTFESAFKIFGEVAMQGLMTDPKVAQEFDAIGNDFDKAKLNALGAEAGEAKPAQDKPK